MADASVHATIEVDPVRTLLVLGPQVTALCLSEIKNTFTAPSFLSYKNIVEIGIGKALELDEFSTSEAKSRRQLLLQNAYELEPAFAAHKIVETLKYNDSYDAWIKEVFLSTKEMQFNADASRTLQHLLHMRRKGVRLIYTHYDDLLARALGLPVVLLEDEEDVRKWSQGFPALLHLHGVFSRPQSMKLDCLCYQSMVGGGKVADIIREQFQSRSVIFIGYDDQFMDPFLPKILTSFATPHTMPTSLPLLVSMQKKCPINNGALPILVESKTSISSIVKISTTPLGVAPINDSSHPVSLQLVCNTRQGALEVFEILQHCPNILGQVLQDGSDKYILDLQMSRPVLQKIWTQLFAPGIASKLQGLAAIELQGSFVIRLNQQQLMAEGNAVSPTPVLTSATLLPSLSSSATSAASIWKHLVTTSIPSVSTLPHFTIPSGILQAKLDAQKQLQLVNQAALASKLVNQAAVGTNQMPLNQMHHEKVVRRIQSENALENRLEKPEPRKNGILVHQQSAPTFGNTGYLMSPNKIVNPAYPVPSPSVLMNMDRKLREHKIEFVEQQSLSEDGSKTTEVDQGGLKNHVSFEDKKLKFIKEAQEWSRQVGSRIGKKSISEEDDVEITDSKFLVTSTPSYPVSTPLIPINAAGNIVSLPIQSPNATPSSPHSANLSPKLSVPKQPPAFLLGSPQSCSNIFTLLPPTSAIPSMAGPILGPSLSQLPLLSSMPGKPATSNAPSFIPGVLPGSFPLTTPSDQKFIYLMQDGQIVAAPYPQENNTLVKLYDKAEADSSRTTRSPKRTDSPNSDQEYRPSKKRRRSSSLPDVNLLKSPSTDSPASPSSPSPVLPISSSASTGPIPDSSYVSLMSNNLTTPSVFFPSIQLPQTTLIKMEHQNGEPENGHDGHVGNNYPPSPAEDNKLHPVPPGRGPIQLWQFLLDLLLSSDNSHLIQWTGNGYEFHIIQPEEIAKLWGARKNKPRMNYDKLSRGLRYYYSKGIMDKVPGKKLTFKYTCDIQQYIVQRSNLTTPPGPSPSIAKSL